MEKLHKIGSRRPFCFFILFYFTFFSMVFKKKHCFQKKTKNSFPFSVIHIEITTISYINVKICFPKYARKSKLRIFENLTMYHPEYIHRRVGSNFLCCTGIEIIVQKAAIFEYFKKKLGYLMSSLYFYSYFHL